MAAKNDDSGVFIDNAIGGVHGDEARPAVMC